MRRFHVKRNNLGWVLPWIGAMMFLIALVVFVVALIHGGPSDSCPKGEILMPVMVGKVMILECM